MDGLERKKMEESRWKVELVGVRDAQHIGELIGKLPRTQGREREKGLMCVYLLLVFFYNNNI